MAKNNSRLVRTPVFRMSYAKLLEAEPFIENGKPKGDPVYSVEMLFDPEDLDAFEVREDNEWKPADIKKLFVQVAKAEWGSDFDVKGAVDHGGLDWPVRDGNARADEGKEKGKDWESYRGKKAIRGKAHQKYPPQLFVIEGGKYRELDRNIDADMAKARTCFVSGYFAKANLNLRPNLVSGNKYLTVYVNSVLFYKQGERIGGMSADDRFGGIEGGESDYDPTGELDDEIPF